ncbi:MAG: hypothetical protein KBT49_04295 [Bacteroidetes bacterium]|nr:hypothetical protein [Candidatus Colenecus caballi]
MICCRYFRIFFFNWETDQFSTKSEWQDIDGKGNSIREFVTRERGRCLFRSGNEGDCSFFRNNMCDLQIRHGKDAMPSVCRTYPRVISRMPGRLEYALDPCCPAVAFSAQNWTTGHFTVEGDGPQPSDPDFIRRKSVLDSLADSGIPLDKCLEQFADEYNTGIKDIHIGLEGRKLEFARKMTALLIWSCIPSYEGYPTIDNIASFIISVIQKLADRLSTFKSDDWKEMSLLFCDLLIRMENEAGIEEDVEEKYIDIDENGLPRPYPGQWKTETHS